MEKLQLCASNLAHWGKEVTGCFRKRIKFCKDELKILKSKRDVSSVQRYEDVKNQVSCILDQKETLWKQRAKQFWLKEGDHNNNVSCPEVVDNVDRLVPDLASEDFHRPVTEEEVRKAIFQMHPDKSSGLDGMTLTFLKNVGIRLKEIDLSFEVLHYLKRKRKGKTGFIALKLDMSKLITKLFMAAMRWALSFHQEIKSVDAFKDGKASFCQGRERNFGKNNSLALPTCAMSVFLLALKISRDIERMMIKFWWQTSKEARKGIHWMSRDKLSKNKKGGGLGFHDLRDFNLALLGKQGWRLLTRPESLASKVFKARYFSDGNFLSAQLGSNPSFIWRSILESQELVRNGTIWCVGNGQSISVLGEPWLPDATNPNIISTHMALFSAIVANLMAMDSSSWDDGIIGDLFEERNQRLIKRIPLQVTTASDKLYWTKEVLGMYTVKSAYGLLQLQKGFWYEDTASNFWHKLWSLKVPPKIANLLWRSCSECLPKLVQLRVKRVVICTLCPLCRETEETTLHCLVTCKVVQVCWNRVGIGTTLTPGASSYLDQWKNARNFNMDASWSEYQKGDGRKHWTPPNVNSIKINMDAILFEGGRSYGIGLVARDSNGTLIEGKTSFSQSMVELSLVEAIGIKDALSWIKERQWQNVCLESDCLCVI
ncbi:uncharacterized protein LOC133032398 [Cannabis sativa]|uniref:uncharacterized protein LOC133032398 n=1 Tax=Cannabis sativa TaxID=3483 RepID=UPI0029CA76AF|nr:uncharacterized protein LOC133032398 [Cannabis sativa]